MAGTNSLSEKAINGNLFAYPLCDTEQQGREHTKIVHTAQF